MIIIKVTLYYSVVVLEYYVIFILYVLTQSLTLFHQVLLYCNYFRNTEWADNKTVFYKRKRIWKKRRLCHQMCLISRLLSDTYLYIKRAYKPYIRLYLLILIFKPSLFVLDKITDKDHFPFTMFLVITFVIQTLPLWFAVHINNTLQNVQTSVKNV